MFFTFQNRIGFQDLLFDPRMFPRNCCQILENQFCAFRLSSTRFTRNNDALVLPLSHHEGVAVVTNGEDVWWQFTDLLVSVKLDLLGSVDR
jgi:hypothetical protein